MTRAGKDRAREHDRRRLAEIQAAEEVDRLQDEELAMLESIFFEEFRLCSTASDYGFHRVFQLKVLPATGAKVYADATLRVELPRMYPVSGDMPRVSVQHSTGLSREDLAELRHRVDGILARTDPGQPCVYDVVVGVQELLRERNVRPKSFYEQMEEHKRGVERERQQHSRAVLDQREQRGREQRAHMAKEVEARKLDMEMVAKGIKKTVSSMDVVPSMRSADRYTATESRDIPRVKTKGLSSSANHSVESNLGISYDDVFMLDEEWAKSDFMLGAASVAGTDSTAPLVKSRYLTDFEEMELLGRGGFGSVMKVRNRLDGLLYAVKKVHITSSDPKVRRKILREVTTIARLHHQYIVRYFQAWIEGGQAVLLDSDSDDDFYEEDFFQEDESWATVPDDHDPSSSQILYMQMEYCQNRTLFDVLGLDGVLGPALVWRLFRQVVEAVLYIHSKGMVHRDLKPANIFIDELGNVKLGDFGLAVMLSEQVREGGLDSPDESLTGPAGTPTYRSPEQGVGGTHIDAKADMFALGVILFEMWAAPFSSGMQRVEVLRKLRSSDGVAAVVLECAAALDKTLPEEVVAIISLLLPVAPCSRPSAEALLAKGLIPVHQEQKFMDQAVSALQADTAFRSRVIGELFMSSSRRHDHQQGSIDQAFNLMSKTRRERLDAAGLHRAMAAFDRVEHLFRSHAAVRFDSPLLTPQGSRVREPAAAVLLDQAGVLVQLPHSLTVPFARFVGQAEHPVNLRKYAISRVYRQDVVGGHPGEHLHCDMDVVWTRAPGKRADMAGAHHAELVKLTDRVLSEFSFNTSRFCIVLNHLLFLELAMDAAVHDDPDLKKSCMALLSQLNRRSLATVKKSLLRELKAPEALVDTLTLLDKCSGEWGTALPKLRKNLKLLCKWSPQHEQAMAAVLDQLDVLVELLGVMEIECQLHLNPLMVVNYDVFQSGFIFQAVLEQPSRHAEHLHVATGGRYDALINHYSSKRDTQHGLSLSIAVDKLASVVEPSSSKRQSLAGAGRPLCNDPDHSVLLYCKRNSMVKQRLKVATLLWKAGFRVALDCPHDNADQVVKFCGDHRLSRLVVFNSKAYDSGLVKLHCVGDNTSREISVRNLVSALQAATRAQEPTADVSVEVEFLELSPTKRQKKHKNIKHALSAVSPLVGSLSEDEFRVVAVDLSIDLVKIATSAYKKPAKDRDALVNGLSVAHDKRDHLLALVQRISALLTANLAVRYVFIFSLPDKSCDLLSI